jgi:hypothetical protein
MAQKYTLPPDASDFQLNVTLDKEAMPYVMEWFNAKKKDGENPQRFIRRLLYKAALDFRKEKVQKEIRQEQKTEAATRSQEIKDLEDDFKTIKGAIGADE